MPTQKFKWKLFQFIGIGARAGWGGGARGAAAPQKNLGNSVFWAARGIWAKPCFQVFFVWLHRYFVFLLEVGIVKPLKFTRDSGCLASDKPLVTSKGDYKLKYIFLFFFCIFLGTVLYCTATVGVVNYLESISAQHSRIISYIIDWSLKTLRRSESRVRQPLLVWI